MLGSTKSFEEPRGVGLRWFEISHYPQIEGQRRGEAEALALGRALVPPRRSNERYMKKNLELQI